jgi:HAE1 family hydrophobic/amphiphilic exporter-1
MLASLGLRRKSGGASETVDSTGRAPLQDWHDLVPEQSRIRWLRTAVAAVFVAFPVILFTALRSFFATIGSALGGVTGPVAGRFSVGVEQLGSRYRSFLDRALHRRGLVMGAVGILAVTAVALFGSLGAELIPPLAQGQVTLALELPEGTPLSRTDATVAAIGRRLAKIDGVERVAATVGVSQDGGGAVARRKENRADVHLKLAGAREETEERVLEDVRGVLRDFPGTAFRVQRPSLLSLSTPLEVDVYGYDLERIMQTADDVAAEVGTVRGVRDVQLAMVPGSPEIRVSFDRDRLNRYDLTLSSVASTLQNKVRGTVASQFRDQEKHIDIRVLNDDDQRSTLTAIRDLIVAERDGIPIRLSTIASMEIVQGPSEIHRMGRRRVAIVTANLSGRDLSSTSEEISTRLAGMAMPAGVTAELGGQNDEMRRSFRSLKIATLLAVFLVYLVMASQFESFLYPFIIMFTVPLALVGAVIGLRITGTPLSVVAAIGAIMLAGIVVNNGIVLVDRINQYRRARVPLRDAILDAGAERFRPILMTTITTVLGLLPMALGLGEGAELRAPLAITVIWGLLFATVLTLLVVPVMYTLLTPGDDLGAQPTTAPRRAGEDRFATAPGGGGS